MKKPAAAAMQIQPQLQKNAVNVVSIKAEEVEVSKNKCLKGKYKYFILMTQLLNK